VVALLFPLPSPYRMAIGASNFAVSSLNLLLKTTDKRLVSNGQGFIEGVALLGIPLNARIAISPSGVVAYQAFYDVGDGPGIFVERRAAAYSDPSDQNPADFAVDDEGRVSKGRSFTTNSRGQIVIPVNTREGPYLLIGTPRTYVKAR
jgi:hypothetical protein